eukprot:scaffold71702_cov25-Cyclotella_meneghiniana.AAC.3
MKYLRSDRLKTKSELFGDGLPQMDAISRYYIRIGGASRPRVVIRAIVSALLYHDGVGHLQTDVRREITLAEYGNFLDYRGPCPRRMDNSGGGVCTRVDITPWMCNRPISFVLLGAV